MIENVKPFLNKECQKYLPKQTKQVVSGRRHHSNPLDPFSWPLSPFGQLLRTLTTITSQMSIYTNDEFKEQLIEVSSDIMSDMSNNSHTTKEPIEDYPYSEYPYWNGPETREQKQRNGGYDNPLKQYVCKLFYQLHEVVNECEQNGCNWNTDKIKKEFRMIARQSRFGQDHDKLEQAVGELAEELQNSTGTENQNLALLAQAVQHLFEDFALLNTSFTPQSTMNVIINISNVIGELKNCAQNPYCYYDWNNVYGNYRRLPRSLSINDWQI